MYACPHRRLVLWIQKRTNASFPVGLNWCKRRAYCWCFEVFKHLDEFFLSQSFLPSWTFQVPSLFVLIWTRKKATESIKENKSWIENSEGDIQKNSLFIWNSLSIGALSGCISELGFNIGGSSISCSQTCLWKILCHACMSLTQVCGDTINVLSDYVFEGRFWRVGEFPVSVFQRRRSAD